MRWLPVTMKWVGGLKLEGRAPAGTYPVHSYSSVQPGTGRLPSPRARMGIRPVIW